MRWLFLTARAPYPLEWVREQSPLHMATADVGLVSCEWEGILYPRLPLMWVWFHVNESVPLHMAAADVGLESCEWDCPLHTADRCWGAGIVWMSDEPSDCVLHTAERRSEVGGCMLRQWVFPCDMRTPPVSALGSQWKGDVRSRADVLSCRFDGWEECGHSRYKLITLRSTTDRGQMDSS